MPTSPLPRLVQRQFGLLTAQFLLGMAVNLIGVPSELHAGLAKTSSTVLLFLHFLVALGLIANAFLIWRLSRPSATAHRLAHYGAAAIGAAVLGGILTLAGHWSNLWSYVMAVAFIAAFGVYGRLFAAAVSTSSAEPH